MHSRTNWKRAFETYFVACTIRLLIATVAAGTETYSDTTVANGSTYYYVVTSNDDDPAESGPSNEEGPMAPAAVAPTKPANLAATAGDGVVDLSWDANVTDADLVSYTRGC